MPKSADTILTELYDLLKTKGFSPGAFKDGKKSVLPSNASLISFNFKDEDQDYGTSHISVDDLRDLILFYNRAAVKPAGDSWVKFIKELKNWGLRRGIKGFKLDSVDNIQDYLARRSTKLDESYYGTKYTSYNDRAPGTVKLIIKHSKPLSETDKRYRYVDRIFVENEQGERFLVPTKKPSVGYVYARLIAEGGNPYDERGKHIAELSEDISKLAGFVRATKSKQFNEGVQSAVNEAVEQYYNLRETLRRLRTRRGFTEYFENWQPKLLESGDTAQLESAFKHSSIDPRIQAALPVLGKFNINISEMTESNEFENWANNFLNEELKPSLAGQVDELVELLGKDSDPLPLGPDATNVLGIIEDLIDDESLTRRLVRAAEKDPNNDAKPIIIGWMSENSEDEVYQKILDQIEPEENADNSEPAEPAPAPEPAPTPKNNKAPVKPENSPEAPEPLPGLEDLPDLPVGGEESPEKQPKKPAISEELKRLRVLSGLVR